MKKKRATDLTNRHEYCTQPRENWREALEAANSTILEPIMDVEVAYKWLQLLTSVQIRAIRGLRKRALDESHFEPKKSSPSIPSWFIPPKHCNDILSRNNEQLVVRFEIDWNRVSGMKQHFVVLS